MVIKKNACRRTLTGTVLCALALFSTQAYAAPEEIQVYMDEFAEVGKFGLDLHTIYVASTRGVPGALPEHQLRLTPELSYGLNEHVEAAAYFLTNKAPGQGVQSDGIKVRARWRAFIPTEQTIWYGAVNMELGKLARRFNTAYSNGEIKAILTARSGPWVAGINLNIDRPLRQAAAVPATKEVDAKLAYAFDKELSIGVEHYAFLGPLHGEATGFAPNRTTFVVADFTVAKWDINFGIGRARGDIPDSIIVKAIIGVPF